MKRMTLLFLATLAMISCVSTPQPPDKTTVPETAPEKAKTVKEVKVTINTPILIKETMLFPDGIIDQYITYQYDKANRLLQAKTSFNASSANPQEKSVYAYKNDLIESETIFDASGQIKGKHSLEMDSKGKLVKDTFKDARDKVVSIQKNEYDQEGNKTKWLTYSGEDLRAIIEYSYAKERLVLAEMKDSGNQAMGSTRFEYDAAGNLVKRVYMDKNGAIERYDMLLWNDGNISEEKTYGAKNNLQIWIVYQDYSDGVARKKLVKDSKGTIVEIREYEYALREDIKTILVTE